MEFFLEEEGDQKMVGLLYSITLVLKPPQSFQIEALETQY